MNMRFLARGLVLFLSFVAIGYLVKTLELDQAWVDAEIRGQGLVGELLFLGLGMAFTAVGLPRQALSFLGGYAFGIVEGTLLATIATAMGCVVTFYYSRFIGRDMVAARFPGRIRRIDDFLADNTFSMTLLIRLLPVGSNVLVNLAAGVSRVPALAFFAGSALGYIPQNLVFALGGSGIEVDSAARVGLGILLFAASGALGVWLYRRHRQAKSFDPEVEEEIS